MAESQGGSGNASALAGLDLSPIFKLVFISIVALTVLSLLASLFVMIISASMGIEDTENIKETFLTTWKLGFGAVMGLIGGKAL